MRTNTRLYINHEGTKLVTADDPEECARLFKPFGGVVTQKEAEDWKGQIEKYVPELKPKKTAKKSTPKSNKMKSPEENKDIENG